MLRGFSKGWTVFYGFLGSFTLDFRVERAKLGLARGRGERSDSLIRRPTCSLRPTLQMSFLGLFLGECAHEVAF
jgi:hypothetical protein